MSTHEEKQLLLIDDRYLEEELVDRVGRALEYGLFDWSITPESDGEKAVTMLADGGSTAFHAVLLDVEMKGQKHQGWDLLARIKGIDPSIPVIILSSKLEAAEVQRMLHHGAIYYCEKSFLETNPALLHSVMEATQAYPEEREFETRLSALGLSGDVSEERKGLDRLLHRAVDALSMHSIHEFESTSDVVGVSSYAPEFNRLRDELLLGGSILSACQAGDAFAEDLKRSLTDYDDFLKQTETTEEYLKYKGEVGSRIARRMARIMALEAGAKLSNWQTGALTMLMWFRDLAAAPFLDHGLDLRSDAVFVLDLVLSAIENHDTANPDIDRYLTGSLESYMNKLRANWEQFAARRQPDADPQDLPYIEKLDEMVGNVLGDPKKSRDLAVQAVRIVRTEIATQLQLIGAQIPLTWNPTTDGTAKSLEMLRNRAMSPMRRAFPEGAWGKSEKFFRCYGHTLEWLNECDPTATTARLAVRSCIAVFDWWVRDYLPWAEQVSWRTQTRLTNQVIRSTEKPSLQSANEAQKAVSLATEQPEVEV